MSELTQGARVYLAARFDRQAEMREMAVRLEELGLEVTSRWLEEHPKEMFAPNAVRDLDDVDRAEWLFYFTELPGVYSGGRHVEAGYALGRGKNVVVVGPKENIFCHLPFVRPMADKGALMEWVKEVVK